MSCAVLLNAKEPRLTIWEVRRNPSTASPVLGRFDFVSPSSPLTCCLLGFAASWRRRPLRIARGIREETVNDRGPSSSIIPTEEFKELIRGHDPIRSPFTEFLQKSGERVVTHCRRQLV